MNGRTRRRVLATIGAGAVTATAGCGSLGDTGSTDSTAALQDVPWPELVTDAATRWQRVGQRAADRGSIRAVSVYTKTRRWEDASLRETIAAKTLGAFDRPLTQFFATTVDLRGLLTRFAGERQLIDRVAPEFARRLRDAGVRNVRRASTGFPVPTPDADAQVREFRGNYRTPKIQKICRTRRNNRSHSKRDSYPFAGSSSRGRSTPGGRTSLAARIRRRITNDATG